MRRLITVLALAVFVTTACADNEPAATDPATVTTTGPVPATGSASTTTASATTTAGPAARPDRFGVETTELTFTDPDRPTPASGDQPGRDERVLDTVVFHPTEVGPYPLIVFSHGLGGSPEGAAALIERWVAAGFVVAAPRFPLSRPDNPAGPDAGDVQNQSGDVGFLIDAMTAESADPDSPFAGLVDPERVGAAGHSNGAITTIGATIHTCCADDRIDAAVEIAGTTSPFAGGEYDVDLAPPYLIVHGTDDELVDYNAGVWLYNQLAGPKGILTQDGGGHSDMFDPASPWFEEVAEATTDFWSAHLIDDTAAGARLVGGFHRNLRWSDGTGSVDVVPTTTLAGIDRRVTVEPTTGLVDGDLVTVTWSGFVPDGTVNVVQCAGGGTSGSSFCDLTSAFILQPNPTGSGTVELEVIVGPVGEGSCGPDADCVITVNDSGNTTDPDATIQVPIEFAG